MNESLNKIIYTELKRLLDMSEEQFISEEHRLLIEQLEILNRLEKTSSK
jgi:hypothetical protein